MWRPPGKPRLCGMTSTVPGTERATPPKVLRRSRTDRVGAGVAGGLGQYFGFDPVLFRVLFATAAFFGGVGVIAYVLAWIAIPEEGADNPAVDRWLEWLRRRRVPVWVVAVGAGVLLWLVAFSWWQPHVFWPLIAAVIVLAIALAHQSRQPPPAGTGPDQMTAPPTAPTTPMAPGGPVDLSKPPAPTMPPGPFPAAASSGQWRDQT